MILHLGRLEQKRGYLSTNYHETDVEGELMDLCDANGRNSCNFPDNIVIGAIADIKDTILDILVFGIQLIN